MCSHIFYPFIEILQEIAPNVQFLMPSINIPKA